MGSTTVRSDIEPTISELSGNSPAKALRQVVMKEWRDPGQADLVLALRRHPDLLRNRSLLLDLAIEEYTARRSLSNNIDLERYCRRFRQFGSSIERSVFRQLETQRYIDEHPDLLEIVREPKWPNVGEAFGDFHILEELGRGATARVYLSLEGGLGNRQVVVKATPYSTLEASILGRLSHPNIIPIYSTGRVEEYSLQYLCMPYCGRSTFADLLDLAFENGCPRRDDLIPAAASRWIFDEQRLPVDRRRGLASRLTCRSYIDGILTIAVQISDALDHAHRQGILHGDLKPSNVLLTPAELPLLLDFNLSQEFATSVGVWGGTLPYMPPEALQLIAGQGPENETATFDPTSDVYSFGALLYELLAGVTPVKLPPEVSDLSTIAVLLRCQLQRGAPLIRQFNPYVGRQLESLVLECLAFDRSDRPPTMAAVKRRLETEMRPAASLRRTVRLRPVASLAAVSLPLVLIISAAAYFASQPPRYLANYEYGAQLAAAGDFENAAEYFAAAANLNPSFALARFQLGRTRIALGDIDQAMNDFAAVQRIENNASAMAYRGYCFNLNGMPGAAIPWYERAIQNGAASLAIYNNLGASYLAGQTQYTRSEKLQRAERNLSQALELNSESLTVQRNIVRLATAKSNVDASYDPFSVWRHAQIVLKTLGKDKSVRSNVGAWYEAVLKHDSAGAETQMSQRQMSAEVESARAAFEVVRREFRSSILTETSRSSAETRGSAKVETSESVRRYYIEPRLPFGPTS